MEAAQPITYEKPSENFIAENFELVEELIAKKNNEEYNIQLGAMENKNYLVIKSFSNSSKNMFYFQQGYNIYDLRRLSKVFAFYDSIEDVISFLSKLSIKIEPKKEEIIIKFEAFLPNGENKLIEFKLKKQLISTKNLVKNLLNEITNLKNKHESDINELKEKYNSKIANLKNENKKLWHEINNLKKISEGKKIGKINEITDLSNILNSNNQLDFIFRYIGQNDPEFAFHNIRLLYRGSRDGDRTKICHELCDHKQNVIVLILSDTGFIFGGFSKIGFEANNLFPNCQIDNNSFLFSVNLKKIYPVIKNEEAICHIENSYGLCFYASLVFYDNFMNYSDGNIFGNDDMKIFSKPPNKFEMNGGKPKFKCSELEVFQLL